MKKFLFIISNGFEKAVRASRAFQFAQVARERKDWFLVAILSCIVFLGMCGFILHPLDLATCKARGGTLIEDQDCQSV